MKKTTGKPPRTPGDDEGERAAAAENSSAIAAANAQVSHVAMSHLLNRARTRHGLMTPVCERPANSVLERIAFVADAALSGWTECLGAPLQDDVRRLVSRHMRRDFVA